MRSYWLTLASGLLVAPLALAQQPSAAPPAAPPAAAVPSRLDTLLVRWEQEMKSIQTLAAQCNRIETDKVNGSSEIYVGSAKYMRPNLAVLEMTKKNNPQVGEKFICTGTLLYEIRPQNKVMRIHELPPPQAGQIADDSFLSFLFGMKAEEAKRRYDMTLVKEDQWYFYLEIVPKLPADKADFQRARMVLNNKTFLPRELWFEQPNGNETKWDIPELSSSAKLTKNDFTPPTPPKDWNVVRVPRAEAVPPRQDVPPRIVRPANQGERQE